MTDLLLGDEVLPRRQNKAHTRTQRDKDSNLIEGVIQKRKEVIVLDMICSGSSIYTTAEEQGLTPTQVRNMLSETLESYHDAIHDHAEVVYNVNHLRLENLYARSMSAAFSKVDACNDGTIIMTDNERRWVQLALSILREQNRMSESHTKNMTPPDDKEDAKQTNVYAPTLTLVAKDDMYSIAQEKMAKDFMNKHADRLGGRGLNELTSDDLITMQLEKPGEAPLPPVKLDAETESTMSFAEKLEDLQSRLGVDPEEVSGDNES